TTNSSITYLVVCNYTKVSCCRSLPWYFAYSRYRCLSSLERPVPIDRGDSCSAFFGSWRIMRFYLLEKRSVIRRYFTPFPRFGYRILWSVALDCSSSGMLFGNPRYCYHRRWNVPPPPLAGFCAILNQRNAAKSAHDK